MSMAKSWKALFVSLAILPCLGRPAEAVVIFSQTPAATNAFGSDRQINANGDRIADDFSLVAPATVRSVVWRGAYAPTDSPVFPTLFDLTIYADSAGLPGAVLSNTTVGVTGVDTGVDILGFDLYEFAADLTPTVLGAGTPFWFSAIADTATDVDDSWFWLTGSGLSRAFQPDVTGNGPWQLTANLDQYFILSDVAFSAVVIPEPASAGLLALAGLALARRRRRVA